MVMVTVSFPVPMVRAIFGEKISRLGGEVTKRGGRNFIGMKPAVGFMLPWAAVTPAPGENKARNVEDDISLSGSSGELRLNVGEGATAQDADVRRRCLVFLVALFPGVILERSEESRILVWLAPEGRGGRTAARANFALWRAPE
jgi:hypothetical protein